MSKIRIKNFGPIKEGFSEVLADGTLNEWMDVKKVTVFIGNQGSGKSVVAKLISTFTWIEKALTRGDYDKKHFEQAFSKKDQSKNQYLNYHRLENYFPKTAETLIDYRGHSFHFYFQNGKLSIEDARNGEYPLPQVMYVPADRNFIANVRTPGALKQISPALSELVTELINAGNALKGPMLLPINDENGKEIYVEYNKLNDIFYISGKDYKIKLTEASSGFQSLVPLFLPSWFLSDSVRKQSENAKPPLSGEQRERFRKRVQEINDNSDFTDELRRIAISDLAKEFVKTAFVNIVEEPEQNLFPTSQQKILNSLLAFNNLDQNNKLIMTTHSPYLINYLTLAVKANMLKDLLKTDVQRKKLKGIVPEASSINPNDLVIYELYESKGTIKKLEPYDNLPSDENELNEKLGEGNELFAQLLELEQSL